MAQASSYNSKIVPNLFLLPVQFQFILNDDISRLFPTKTLIIVILLSFFSLVIFLTLP